MSILEIAAKALISVGAKPALERLKRQEEVVALLKKFKLAPEVSPADFEGVYTYALIEYCYGMPEPIINFFRNEYIQSAFRRSFETGDTSYLSKEADEIVSWNDETGALGRLDYDFRRDLAGFTAMFDAVVDRTRSPSAARAERKIDGYGKSLHIFLSDLKQQISEMAALADVRQLVPEIPKGNAATLESLRKEMRDWFNAIGYRFETYEHATEVHFTWILNVPARRRYDRIVVRGVAGEATADDVDQLAELVRSKSADEGWLVVPRRISAAAANVAAADGNSVACYTLDTLIDQDADFDPYLEWLESEVARRGIDSRYIQVACKKDEVDPTGKVRTQSVYDAETGGIEHYVETWLADSTKEHLSILGEFGTGKSWFCLHFAWTRAKQYQQAKKRGLPRPRLPLLVPLRDYAKAVSIESLFSEFFFRKHEVNLPGYSAFEYLNRTGRLLLIFDGFDEMANRVDRQARINNFWELARAVTEKAKILLTCRSEHFPEAAESRDLLSARLMASTQSLTGEPPQFEVVDLLPFDDAQVRELLTHLTDEETLEVIIGNSALLDLMRRPVMSELVLDALPEISAGGTVDIARVYLYAVRRKISRDIHAERTFTSMGDKVYFLSELSWEMLSTDSMQLNYREFPDRIRACFGDAVREQRDLDHWHHDMMGQSLLIRNNHGDYSPAHRSLIEFFVAYKFAAELGVMNRDFVELTALEGRDVEAESTEVRWSELVRTPGPKGPTSVTISGFSQEPAEALSSSVGALDLSPAVIQLLLPMIDASTGEGRLRDLIQQTRSMTRTEARLLGGNCATLIARLNAKSLRGANLPGVNLRGAKLDLFKADGFDLSHACLSGADLSGTDLENVAFNGAILSDCILESSRYFGLNGSGFASIIPHTDTSAVFLTTAAGSIVTWTSTADIGAREPTVLHPSGERLREIEVVGSQYLIAATMAGTFYIYDIASGRLIKRVEDAVGVAGIDQDGVQGFVASYPNATSDLEGLHVHSFEGHSYGCVGMDFDWDFGYFSQSLGKTIFLDRAGLITSLQLGMGVAELAEVCRLDLSLLDLPSNDPLRSVHTAYSGELIWVLTERGSVIVYDLAGKIVQQLQFRDYDEDFDVELWSMYTRPWVIADAAADIGVFRTPKTLTAFRISSGRTLWATKNDARVSSVALVDGGTRCVLVDRYGVVEVRLASDGSVQTRICMNDAYRGTVLSGVAGVHPAILQRLAMAGAIVE